MLDAKKISRLYGTRDVMLAISDVIHGDVLDFGAGGGKQRQLAKSKASSYTALDIDPGLGVDIVGDVLDPPIADGSYDTVISNQVMEHVRRPWVMIGHVARILRPGGVCILSAPFMAPYHANPTDYFRFTEQGMRSLCEDSGLEIVLCTKHGGFFASAGELIKHRFFSPLSPRSRFNKILARRIEPLFRLLDKLTPPGIVYNNVICIARKK